MFACPRQQCLPLSRSKRLEEQLARQRPRWSRRWPLRWRPAGFGRGRENGPDAGPDGRARLEAGRQFAARHRCFALQRWQTRRPIERARRGNHPRRSARPRTTGGAARRPECDLHDRHEVRFDGPAAAHLGHECLPVGHDCRAFCTKPHRGLFDRQRLPVSAVSFWRSVRGRRTGARSANTP